MKQLKVQGKQTMDILLARKEPDDLNSMTSDLVSLVVSDSQRAASNRVVVNQD